MPCHVNNSACCSGEGWCKVGFQPFQKMYLYIVRGAYVLEGTGDINGETKGFFSVLFDILGQYSKQSSFTDSH